VGEVCAPALRTMALAAHMASTETDAAVVNLFFIGRFPGFLYFCHCRQRSKPGADEGAQNGITIKPG
jgi:hypothetical protein